MKVGYGCAFALWILGTGAAACGPHDPPAATGSTSGAGGAGSTSGGAGGASSGAGGACPGSGSSVSAGAGGAGGAACSGPGERFVTSVVSACFGPGSAFGHDKLPGIVLGPPHGGGCCAGSLDVCSLGEGGTITLAFDNVIVDGPGVDFIVFENAFDEGGNPSDPFAEIATVEVSPDGVAWAAFPCTATAFPYGSCAGWHPVLGGVGTGVDPLDPAVAGGDPYDLADIGVPLARFVRITDRADVAGTFDLDAVGIVNAACP